MVKSHTIDVVPFDEPAASFSHDNAVRVSVADEVVLQDGVASSADVDAPPLVLSDHVIWKTEPCCYSERSGGGRPLRTCDQPPAVLVHGDPGRLALEDVIPANTGKEDRGESDCTINPWR